MPKMQLTADNKAKNSYEFPKLFLDKGERARIVLLDPTPLTEYVHTMRAPQIINGQPVMEKDDKGADRMKFDFVGRHVCIGSFDVISKKGLDVEACPVCAESKKSDAVKPPERRHALNVLRYKTQHGSFDIQSPFQVELVVWAFADGVFNKLVEFAGEWGDLRKHDLMLGPCEVKMYQKMDINVSGKAMWTTSPENQKLAVEVFNNNSVPDLTVAIGRKLTKEMVLEDLSRVVEKHAVAHGKPAQQPATAAEVDVSGILDTPAEKPTQPAQSEDPWASPSDNTIGVPGGDPEPKPDVEKKPEPAPAASSSADDMMDLDAILGT